MSGTRGTPGLPDPNDGYLAVTLAPSHTRSRRRARGRGGSILRPPAVKPVLPSNPITIGPESVVIRQGGSGYVRDATGQFVQKAVYSGGAVPIADGATKPLDWALTTGTDLFDLTDPFHPAAVESGVYALTATVYVGSPVTPGGGFDVEIDAQSGTFAQMNSATATATVTQPAVAVTLITFLQVGETFTVLATNHDGGAVSHNFNLKAIVQRIW